MAIPSLLGSYIDETYQRLVQVTGSGTEFADGLGNPITFGTTPTGSLLTTASVSSNTITFTKGDGTTFPITVDTGSGGGVTKITAGSSITISPSSGLGNVTINSTAAAYNTATGSYGSFYDTGSYAATSATAIYSMSLSTTDTSNGVFISGSTNPYNTYIKFTNAGVYNVQFSAQFSNSDGAGVDVAIWLRKNDNSSANDLADTTGICTVPPKKASLNGQTITSWNYFVSVAANDYIQLLWHTAVPNVITLETIAAGTNPIHPRTPSLILTAQRVDTFLSNTGSFSGSFTGVFTGSLQGTASWATNALTASLAPSYVLNVSTGSFITTGSSSTTQGISGSLALTGSLRITGSAIISGSVVVSGSQTSNVANGGTGITIQGSQGSIGLAINTLGGLNGTGARTHILLGQTTLPAGGQSYAIYSSLNMRSYFAGGLETAGILFMTNNSAPIRLGAVSDTAADGTYGQFMMSTGPNSRPQWATVSIPAVPDFASINETNLGTTPLKTISPGILEESKYTTHNLYNYQNFS